MIDWELVDYYFSLPFVSTTMKGLPFSIGDKYELKPEYKKKALEEQIERIGEQVEQLTLLLTEKQKLLSDKKRELENL